MIPISTPGHRAGRGARPSPRSSAPACSPWARRTAELEEAWADYCGVKHAVAMGNGTVALEAILRGLGIGPGDEVITVSHTFNATVSAILQAGRDAGLRRHRADDFCIDPDRVEAAITPRTRAILPVHLFGLVADMDPIVGDRATGTASRSSRTPPGPRRDVPRPAGRAASGTAMFSLYATKNMTTGEGGFVTTDDDGLADRLRLYRNQGMRVRYHHESSATTSS